MCVPKSKLRYSNSDVFPILGPYLDFLSFVTENKDFCDALNKGIVKNKMYKRK
jgi:hypothetical protein